MDRGQYQERLGHRLCELDVSTGGIRPDVALGPAIHPGGQPLTGPCAGENGKIG
jgi:hypothetical protein